MAKEKRTQTHIQVDVIDKEFLEDYRDKNRLASIAAVIAIIVQQLKKGK